MKYKMSNEKKVDSFYFIGRNFKIFRNTDNKYFFRVYNFFTGEVLYDSAEKMNWFFNNPRKAKEEVCRFFVGEKQF